MTETDVLARQIAKGIRLHQHGRLTEAEKVYSRVLRKDPHNVNALNFLGVLTQQRGDGMRAIHLLEECILQDPQYVDAHQNLVRMLLEQGGHERALQVAEKLISISPYSAEAFISQGLCYEKLGQFAAARESLERGLQLDGSHIKGRLKLAGVLRELGEADIAAEHYRGILDVDPAFEVAYESLGMLLYKQGQIEQAANIYRRWLDECPDNARAAHLYAACSDAAAPDRASDAYVAEVFDSFADTFDENLSDLNYQAPQLVADALAATNPERTLVVLDAGCGTGLCGPLLQQFAARQVGVDLSAGMLEKAELLGVYDELHKMELIAFMQSTAEKFDCIISADTLVYFGDLLPVFAAAVDVLKPGGVFIFTVERMGQSSSEDYRLNPHGRYSHSRQYVADSLAAGGLNLERTDDVVLRKEVDQDVKGLLLVARKKVG